MGMKTIERGILKQASTGKTVVMAGEPPKAAGGSFSESASESGVAIGF